MHSPGVTVSDRRCPTLPNCDRCGQFASNPTVRSWCTGGNAMGSHICHEELTCPRCTEKENPQ